MRTGWWWFLRTFDTILPLWGPFWSSQNSVCVCVYTLFVLDRYYQISPECTVQSLVVPAVPVFLSIYLVIPVLGCFIYLQLLIHNFVLLKMMTYLNVPLAALQRQCMYSMMPKLQRWNLSEFPLRQQFCTVKLINLDSIHSGVMLCMSEKWVSSWLINSSINWEGTLRGKT